MAPNGPQFAPGDKEIVRWLAHLNVALSDDISELTHRQVKIIRGRFRALKKLGLVNYTTHPDNWFLKVWYLTRAGWRKAHDLEYVEDAIYAQDKRSPQNLPHDLLVTKLILAFLKLEEEGTIKGFKFSASYRKLYDHWGRAETEYVKPDLFFSFERHGVYPCFFVEVERGKSHSENGKSDRVLKMENYAKYPRKRFEERFGADDFFVLTFLPSFEKARNFTLRLAESDNQYLRTRKFWAGDISLIERPLAKEFMTPKDEALSLLDAASFRD